MKAIGDLVVSSRSNELFRCQIRRAPSHLRQIGKCGHAPATVDGSAFANKVVSSDSAWLDDSDKRFAQRGDGRMLQADGLLLSAGLGPSLNSGRTQ